MLDRLHAIRSTSGKVVAGLALATTLAIAGCGGSSSTGATGTATATTPTACKVTAADLTGTDQKATATKATGISGKLDISGSSALAPLFNRAKDEFDTANGTSTTVTANGSGNGITQVESGAVQIGMSDVFKEDRPNPSTYSDLVDHQVAAVVFTLVVNNDIASQVTDLTVDQIKQIYTGQVTNWSAVGGPNEAITVINRPSTSGTRGTFKKYVLGGATEQGQALQQDTTGAVVAAVKGTPGAIGYAATSYVQSNATDVSPICIGGAKPIAADVNSGKYNFWAIEHAYTKGPATGNAKAFIQYALSSDFQSKDLPALNFYKLSTVSAAAITAHTTSGAPAPESLS
jgi:phosphate transport system substrate-binding protein